MSIRQWPITPMSPAWWTALNTWWVWRTVSMDRKAVVPPRIISAQASWAETWREAGSCAASSGHTTWRSQGSSGISSPAPRNRV